MILSVGLTGDEITVNEENVREGTRTYLVISNNPFETTLAIRLDPRVPKPFSRHPTEPGVYAKTVTPTRVTGTKFQWNVVVTYSSQVREQEKNPLARPPKISGEFNNYEVPVHVDRNKRPLVTTAGEPLSGITTEDSDLILNVEKNMPDIPRWVLTYSNAINDGAVRIGSVTFPKGTLKLRGIRFSETQWENDVPFIVLSFQLHFRRKGWKKQHLNAGKKELRKSERDGKTELVDIEEGKPPKPVTEPRLIDRAGRHIKPDENGQIDPNRIYVLDFDLDDERPFSVLPLR